MQKIRTSCKNGSLLVGKAKIHPNRALVNSFYHFAVRKFWGFAGGETPPLHPGTHCDRSRRGWVARPTLYFSRNTHSLWIVKLMKNRRVSTMNLMAVAMRSLPPAVKLSRKDTSTAERSIWGMHRQ